MVPLDRSLSGLAFKTGQTLHCDDVENDSSVELELCRALHVVSAVCVPLRHGDKTVGVFNVASYRSRAFDDRDVVTLTNLAEFISVTIASAVDLASVTDSLLCRARHAAP